MAKKKVLKKILFGAIYTELTLGGHFQRSQIYISFTARFHVSKFSSTPSPLSPPPSLLKVLEPPPPLSTIPSVFFVIVIYHPLLLI